jgi:hypothetical protein
LIDAIFGNSACAGGGGYGSAGVGGSRSPRSASGARIRGKDLPNTVTRVSRSVTPLGVRTGTARGAGVR